MNALLILLILGFINNFDCIYIRVRVRVRVSVRHGLGLGFFMD